MELYRRYRIWASQLNQTAIVILSVSAAMIGVVALSLAGPDGRPVIFWKILPWLALVGGPLAAFDAWGAAAFRGHAREGIVRAAIILTTSWGFAAYAFLR